MCAASLLEALHMLFLLPLVRFLLLLLERRSCHQGKNIIEVQKTWVRLDQVPYSRSLDHSDTRSYPRDSPEDERCTDRDRIRTCALSDVNYRTDVSFDLSYQYETFTYF